MSQPYRVPDLAGPCCSCEACVVAGISHRPVVRTPEGELHGVKLVRWYAAKDAFDEALRRFRLKTMLPAIVPREPGEEG